jgi:hypothetical protein
MQPDLNAIERRAEAATKGPWSFSHGRNELAVVSDEPTLPTRSEDQVRYGDRPIADCEFGYGDDEANQDFIAHARTDIPALLAHVRALEAERARLREECEALKVLIRELRDDTGGGGLSWSYWRDHNPESEFESRDAWLSKFRADEDAHDAVFQAETEQLIRDTIARAALDPNRSE